MWEHGARKDGNCVREIERKKLEKEWKEKKRERSSQKPIVLPVSSRLALQLRSVSTDRPASCTHRWFIESYIKTLIIPTSFSLVWEVWRLAEEKHSVSVSTITEISLSLFLTPSPLLIFYLCRLLEWMLRVHCSSLLDMLCLGVFSHLSPF